MSFPERRVNSGTLTLSCLVLVLAGCGGGGEGSAVDVGNGEEQASERTDEATSVPPVVAAALPTDAIDPAAGNPFEVPDPDAPAPPEAPSGALPEPAESELPTHAPDGTPYCD